jgi:hypothetical protein
MLCIKFDKNRLGFILADFLQIHLVTRVDNCMVNFHTKFQIWVYFGGPKYGKGIFLVISDILQPFDIFYGHLGFIFILC